MIREKLRETIRNLCRIKITSPNVCAFYSAHFMRKVYFRCAIMKMKPKQE